MALLSRLLISPLRRRFDRWIAERHPRSRNRIVLDQRHLYILPTRFGYLFAMMLVALLLASINYQNSMAYVMTFTLTAIGILSLWQTHRNLLGLQIEPERPPAVFAGEPLPLPLTLHNPGSQPRYAVGFQYGQQPPVYCRLDPDTAARITLPLPTSRRGRFRPRGIIVFTRYPTGLFHAWSWLRLDTELWVYPQPRSDRRLIETLIDDTEGPGVRDSIDGDDFAGLREHQPGESLRHISWKAYAQGRGMLTKTFQGHAAPALWIDYRDMDAPSLEGRLSQMAGLVLAAEQAGRRYGLRLPDRELEQDLGPAHREHCLRALAEFQQPDAGGELPLPDEDAG